MRGVLIFLGLLLLLAGGGLAAVNYLKVDVSSALASMPAAQEFIASQNALYAGAGGAGLGLLLIIIGAVTGGKKKEKPAKAAKPAPKAKAKPPPKAAEAKQQPKPEPKPEPKHQPKPAEAKPELKPEPKPKPVEAKQTSKPEAKPAPTSEPKQQAKPQASSQPPPGAQPQTALPVRDDPRLMNRRRVSDLVSINDALKEFHKKHGQYPKAREMGGFLERGANWIPQLVPEFIAELPRDPAMSNDKGGPQYLYASDGTNYKLLANGVSLVGGTNVEVLGVRIDRSRSPKAENCSFGFWTQDFATV